MPRMFKYEVEKTDRGYQFVLYPNNSNTQELGKSVVYDTQKDCEDALEEFRYFVKSNSICEYDETYMRIERKEKYCVVYFKDGRDIFSTRGCETKYNAKKVLPDIFKYIDGDN